MNPPFSSSLFLIESYFHRKHENSLNMGGRSCQVAYSIHTEIRRGVSTVWTSWESSLLRDCTVQHFLVTNDYFAKITFTCNVDQFTDAFIFESVLFTSKPPFLGS